MSEEYTLREFVKACNELMKDEKNIVNESGSYKAERLGIDFDKLNKKEKLNEVSGDNREFYYYLLRHCNNGKSYTFSEQDGKEDEEGVITAKINVFEPYINEEVNQMWHVIISTLAWIDASKNDVIFSEHMSYIDNHFLEICKDRELNRIMFSDGKLVIPIKNYKKPYPSPKMKNQTMIIEKKLKEIMR